MLHAVQAMRQPHRSDRGPDCRPSGALRRWGWEVQVAVGAARAAMDLLAMLGGATLAVSAVVLGASMFPPDDAVRPQDTPVCVSRVCRTCVCRARVGGQLCTLATALLAGLVLQTVRFLLRSSNISPEGSCMATMHFGTIACRRCSVLLTLWCRG